MTTHRGQQRDKPFRDALRMEIAAVGDNHKALRRIAVKLIDRANKGDMTAIKEIADRLDGKIPQAIVGDESHDPIQVQFTDDQRAKALALLIAKHNASK